MCHRKQELKDLIHPAKNSYRSNESNCSIVFHGPKSYSRRLPHVFNQMFTRSKSDKFFITYPSVLNAQNFGEYADWRLPTLKELCSLMNFNGTDPSGSDTQAMTPFIDTDYFDFAYGDTNAGERIIDAQFWSANTYSGYVFENQAATFGLNLADGGIKGYPADGPIEKMNYVYFMRGNTGYGVNHYIDNGDGTVTDRATGLMWTQDDSAVGMNWEQARKHSLNHPMPREK